MPPPLSPGPTCKWTAYTPQPDRLISLAAQLRSVRPKPRRNTRVIPSAASTALTATATRDTTANARYGATRRTGYGSPTSPSRHCPAINDRRRRWAASTIDDRRCAAFGQPAPAAGLRIQQRVAPALARRRGSGRTGDPCCRAQATTGRGLVVGAASDLAADLRPYRARMHPRPARTPARPRSGGVGISDLAGW